MRGLLWGLRSLRHHHGYLDSTHVRTNGKPIPVSVGTPTGRSRTGEANSKFASHQSPSSQAFLQGI